MKLCKTVCKVRRRGQWSCRSGGTEICPAGDGVIRIGEPAGESVVTRRRGTARYDEVTRRRGTVRYDEVTRRRGTARYDEVTWRR